MDSLPDVHLQEQQAGSKSELHDLAVSMVLQQIASQDATC